MKCREFESVMADVAREREPDAVRREALDHAASCARCAARLAEEREVAHALRTFAESNSDRGAPARVEAALLAAFVQPRPVVMRKPAGRVLRWAVPAAAAAAVALAVWAGLRIETAPAVRTPAAPPRAAETKPVAVPVAAAPVKPARKVVARKPVRRKAVKQEVATRFYRLHDLGEDADPPSGPVVRIQLPRRALASFGFPIDPERMWETVQADVALDDTGTAREIRFVRER